MKSANILVPAFVSGACAMAVELGGSRIIAPYLGTTIYTWAAVIGFVMAALSAGYYFGGVFAERHNDRKHFSTIFLLAAFCTLLVPLLARLIVPLTVFLPLAWASLISAIVLVPASFFYGMVSPYAIKLISKADDAGRSSGAVFSLSTVGSIAGTLATGFLLIPNLGVSYIFIGTAALMVLAGWAAGRGFSGLDIGILAFFAACAALVSFSPVVNGALVYQAESEYHAISVFDNVTVKNAIGRMLVLDECRCSAETVPGGAPMFDYVSYTVQAYGITKDPKQALVIGIAGGTEMNELKKSYPDIIVDGVDIDGKAVDAGLRYFSLRLDNRTSIIIDDGRRYVQTTDKKYDIVLVDAFRGRSAPSHMASVEFVGALKSVMSPGGVAVVNVISPVEGAESTLLSLMYNTYAKEFANVAVVPMDPDPKKAQNVVLIATDSSLSDFVASHPGDVYDFRPSTDQVVTDELNPVELFAQ